jgi:enoyl-CoA hydratase/carnithine racemase
MSGYETLIDEVRDGIGYVTINRPEKLNALNRKVMDELDRCFREMSLASTVRVVILTGAGEKAFAAGADINELAAQTPAEGREKAIHGQGVLDRIERLGKPVIAAVNGFALGGGCELALACTLRVAAEKARFGQPEVKLGLIPGYGGTQRLPRLVGPGRALQLILTGEMITAAEAYEMGLVNRVVPQNELMGAAEALARQMMANAPQAVRFAMEAVRQGLEMSQEQGQVLEAALFGLCCATADMKEGTRAFLEKRPARFVGK